MIPEADTDLVRRWAHDKTPAQFRDQMRVEVDEAPRGLTIVECRPPWREDLGPEWTRQPIARLAYVAKRSEWTLYWTDRNSKFHRYDMVEPTNAVTDLLAEIDRDPTCIFWG